MQIPVFQDERGNTIIGDISKQRNFNIRCEFGGGGKIYIFFLRVVLG